MAAADAVHIATAAFRWIDFLLTRNSTHIEFAPDHRRTRG